MEEEVSEDEENPEHSENGTTISSKEKMDEENIDTDQEITESESIPNQNDGIKETVKIGLKSKI